MRGSAALRIGVAPGGALAGPWVRDPLWRNARAVPSLDLDFANNKSLTDRVTSQNLVTFTRASSGTFTGSDGLLKTAATNEPRFDHNPTTGESLGLLVEEARTNLLLNSATLSTQSVTVAAAANTLSFYGTGTVTLTGVSTAGPLVGTGANNRVSLTFTPTVGVLVLTVSGSVTNAQLEAGAFATSYIPTTTATVTRAADVASITGSAFSSWYRQDEGTIYFKGSSLRSSGSPATRSFQFEDGTTANNIRTSGTSTLQVISTTTTQCNLTSTPNIVLDGSLYDFASAYKVDDFATSTGSAASVDTTGTIPAVDRLVLGGGTSAGILNGTISRLTYWPVRLQNNILQAITQ